jgi:hypothetical protein
MKTTWVVQSNIADSDSERLFESASQLVGRKCVSVVVETGQAALPDLGDLQPPVVFHGLTTLVLRACESARWGRGVFYDAENFTHEAYAKGFGAAYLNFDAKVMDWATLVDLASKSSRPLFIKPVNDLKAFTGFVASFEQMAALHRKLTASTRELLPDVVVAAQQEVDAEWRLFVVDGEIVAGSMYRPTAEAYLPDDLIAFAADCICRWTPSPVFVLDVGRVDSQWRVIECNCFNWSRFYAANVPLIVERVSQFQERNWKD